MFLELPDNCFQLHVDSIVSGFFIHLNSYAVLFGFLDPDPHKYVDPRGKTSSEKPIIFKWKHYRFFPGVIHFFQALPLNEMKSRILLVSPYLI